MKKYRAFLSHSRLCEVWTVISVVTCIAVDYCMSTTTPTTYHSSCNSVDKLISQLSNEDEVNCTRNAECSKVTCSGHVPGLDSEKFNLTVALNYCIDPVNVTVYLDVPSRGINEWHHTFIDGESVKIPGLEIPSTSYTSIGVYIKMHLLKYRDRHFSNQQYINITVTVTPKMKTFGGAEFPIWSRDVISDVKIAIPPSVCLSTSTLPFTTPKPTDSMPAGPSSSATTVPKQRKCNTHRVYGQCPEHEQCTQRLASASHGVCECVVGYVRNPESQKCESKTQRPSVSAPTSMTSSSSTAAPAASNTPPSSHGTDNNATATSQDSGDGGGAAESGSSRGVVTIAVSISVSVIVSICIGVGIVYLVVRKRIYRRLATCDDGAGADRVMLMTDDEEETDDAILEGTPTSPAPSPSSHS